ncbi:MAG: proline dehydrogenase family protein [Candidatus Binataceae bacterium]
MGLMRSILLAGSQNPWLRERLPRYGFMRKAVARFMPGEEVGDALSAARKLHEIGIATVFTRLGENVTDAEEAGLVTEHYLGVLDQIRSLDLHTEVSVKLTQLGLDLDKELCYTNLMKINERAGPKSTVWIDMEASHYVDVTLELFRRVQSAYPKAGVCLQAYLYRTARDLTALIPLGAAIRLVKGAYKEPRDLAFPKKRSVDENFFALSKQLLSEEARGAGVRAAMATHDTHLIHRMADYAAAQGLSKNCYEFQMLYGIQRAEQIRLARGGWKSVVLVAYGSYWFPWYLRRLAERPANVFFVMRNMLSG